MRCPYLSSTSSKECVKMLEQNMDDKLSEFDLKHFCDGNPIFCYYFRLPQLELKSAADGVERPMQHNCPEAEIHKWQDLIAESLSESVIHEKDRFTSLKR